MMLAQIGIMQALHRHEERVFTDRKATIGESGSWQGIGDGRPSSIGD
jgi:hypothetical protein